MEPDKIKSYTAKEMEADGTTTIQSDNLTLKFLLVLSGYFILHIVLRVYISDSLDYDEAEQALLGQWLLAGYTEQPPLYTWVQYFLFETLGRNVLAVSLLKNSLLFLTYIFVYLSARQILTDPPRAVLATCSLLLIPQIGWESQRDMTHTTLVVCATAATMYQTLRLARNRSLLNYLVLGLFLSVGFLAKANFGLFLCVILLTLIGSEKGRKVIFNRHMLLCLAVTAIATGSYFYWMFNNQDIVFSATHKFKRALDNYYILGPVSLITKSFLFLTPLWAIYLFIFPKGYGLTDNFSPSFEERFIKRYILLLFLVLLLVVLAFKVTYVKDRWLQPLLFAAPIYFFSRLELQKISITRFKAFLWTVAIAACAIYIAFSVRVVGGSYIDRFCRMNYPFSAMAQDIRQLGFTDGLIISDNRFIAGNLTFQFAGSSAIIPDYRFETLEPPEKHQAVLIAWQADRAKKMPDDLKTFLEKKTNLDTTNSPVHFLEQKYKYGRTETTTLAVMTITKES